MRPILVCLLFSVFYFPPFCFSSPPDLAWDVETSRLAKQALEIRRGETVTLTPRFLSYADVLPLTNAETCVLYYRPAELGTGIYYAVTGAVHNATGGQVRVAWSGAACAAATNYNAEFVVASSNSINLRAFASIRLLDSIYATASTATNPPGVAGDIAAVTGRVAGTLINAPDIRWDVETSALASMPISLRRGESVTLTPRFLDHAAPIPITNSETIIMIYRHSGLATGLYHAASGSIHNGTNGQVRIPFTHVNHAAATNYTYEIVLQGAAVTNLRAYGTITLQDSILGSVCTATDPATWRVIDWTAVSNINLSSAPFALAAVSGISSAQCVAIVGSIVPTSSVAFATSAGSATDSVARAEASAASQAASLVASNLVIATQGIVRASVSYLAATLPDGNLTSNDHIVAAVYLTNGYASSTYSSPGAAGMVSPEISADSNTWYSAFVTGVPCHWRLRTTFFQSDALITNITVHSWALPEVIGISNDFRGQTVHVDNPSSAREAANKTYVDGQISNVSAVGWANYPASTTVRMAGNRLSWDNYSITSSQQWFRIQHAGTDLFRISASNNLLAITNWTVNTTNISLWVATNDLETSPWPEWCTNLVEGTWNQVSPFTTATNGDLSVTLTFTNAWTNSETAFFRAICGATNPTVTALLTDQTTARALIPESITLDGTTRTTWPESGVSAGTVTQIAETVVGSIVPTSSVAFATSAGTATDAVARADASNAQATASAAVPTNIYSAYLETTLTSTNLSGTQLFPVSWSCSGAVARINIVTTGLTAQIVATNLPATGLTADLYVWLCNTNSRPVVWPTNWYWRSSGTLTTNAPTLAAQNELVVRSTFGAIIASVVSTNSTVVLP